MMLHKISQLSEGKDHDVRVAEHHQQYISSKAVAYGPDMYGTLPFSHGRKVGELFASGIGPYPFISREGRMCG